jgi:uncharacterized membrane protein (UPF0127 family)
VLSIRIDNGALLASKVRVISTFRQRHWPFERCVLDGEQGLLLTPGGSVHSFGMPCAIDVAFLDGNWRVLKLVSALPPARWALAPRATRLALLLPAQRMCLSGLNTGMSLSLDPVATQAARACATTVLRRVAANPRVNNRGC